AVGQAASEDQVVDGLRVERGHLVERRLDDQCAEVVGTEVLERTLVGAADGGTRGADDHCLGHGCAFRSVVDAISLRGRASARIDRCVTPTPARCAGPTWTCSPTSTM